MALKYGICNRPKPINNSIYIDNTEFDDGYGNDDEYYKKNKKEFKIKKDTIKYNNIEKFKELCKNGNLKEAIVFFDNLPIESIYITIYECTAYASRNGHLELLKWLLSFNIDSSIFYHFNIACKKEYLDMAKWLYSNYNINLSQDNDFIFYNNCKNNNINIVNWLLTLSNYYWIEMYDGKIINYGKNIIYI